MSEAKKLDILRFLALSGRKLADYAEAFLTADVPVIRLPAAEALVAALPSLDEEHLIYALELAMMAGPEGFLDHLLAYLTHPRASVCCTAYRLLSDAPQVLLPADFLRKLAAIPIVELSTDDLITGEKRAVGTNAEFVRSLINKFA